MHMPNLDADATAAEGPSSSRVPSPASTAVWERILERLADDLDAIVEDFLAELHASNLYQDNLVEIADLRHTAHETFRYLLDRMLDKPMSAHQRGAAKRLGIRRAGQAVQVEDLMAAIRLDFIVLWRRIRAMITPDETPVLVEHTEIILTTIETYIREVQLEFLAETARLARDARLASERHLARLLTSTQLTDSSLELIAQGLQVPLDGEFEVVVIHESAVLEAQEALADPLATGQILGYPYGSGYTLLQLTNAQTQPLSQVCRNFAGSYFTGVHGLAEVPPVVRSLSQLLEYKEDMIGQGVNHLVSIDELWPAALAATLRRLLPSFPEEHLRGLRQLPTAEAREVIASIQHYLSTGSIKATATRMDRHRNTIINRLKTFEDATGLDVKVPRDAVLATLVLAVAERQMHN